MAQTLPWPINAASTEASVIRRGAAAMLGAPLGSFTAAISATTAGGGHGVVGDGDLLVAQHAGTPNLSVDVAAGAFFLRGSSAADAGVYTAQNTSVANLVISGPHATLVRKDLVVVKINDNEYDSSGLESFTLGVVTGTPSGSPADPAVPANTLVLARVTVPAAASSIVNGNITDLRTFVAAIGGMHRCTAATRPTSGSLYVGKEIFEVDSTLVQRWDGSAWCPVMKIAGGVTTMQDVQVVGAKDKPYTANITGSYTIDASNGQQQVLTMTGAVTLNAPTNLDEGESLFVSFVQNATGGWSLTLPGSPNQFLFTGGASLGGAGFATGANAINDFTLRKVSGKVHAFMGSDMKV